MVMKQLLGTLSQLASGFLTVPYLQLPLVLDFFASQDRAAYLFNPEHLGQQGAGR